MTPSPLPLPLREPNGTAGASPALALLTGLLDRLHAEEIRYCHWKSSEHLDASLRGITDLDVLVQRRDARRLARLLTEVDFKPFRKLSGHDYPGIEDYLGFDAATGTLSHLHVHYQLTLGEKFLKGYRLPWEDVVLNSRIWDAARGLYIVDPHLETLLLVMRIALKLRARDFLLAAVGYRYVRGGAARELRWLAQRVDQDRLRREACVLVGERASALLCEIVAAPAPSIRQLIAFRRSVHPPLGTHRMFGMLGALRHRWTREAAWVSAALTNRLRGLRQRSTRSSPQGGLAVYVTGAQPAATTVARRLVAWLAPEMAVVPDLGAHSSVTARRARGLGMIVVADRPAGGPEGGGPDLILRVGDAAASARRFAWLGTPTVDLDGRAAPDTLLLQAKRALWESL